MRPNFLVKEKKARQSKESQGNSKGSIGCEAERKIYARSERGKGRAQDKGRERKGQGNARTENTEQRECNDKVVQGKAEQGQEGSVRQALYTWPPLRTAPFKRSKFAQHKSFCAAGRTV